MTRYRNTLGVSTLSLALISASLASAVADETPPSRFKIDGQINADLILNENGNSNDHIRLADSVVRMSYELSQNIRVVLATQLDRDFRKNGRYNDGFTHMDLENFVREAYVEIKNVGGRPIAFLIGKHEVAWGAQLTRMLDYNSSPTHALNREDQVFGITVALDTKFALFDKVEASFFETRGGDLDIGEFDGVSLRFTKELSEQLKVVASVMHKGNGSDMDDDRVSIGAIWKSRDGQWTAWAQGMYFKGGAFFMPEDSFGIGFGGLGSDDTVSIKTPKHAYTFGVSKQMGDGEMVVELSYIPHALKQIGLGYNLKMSDRLTLGPSIRYTDYAGQMNKKSELTFGLRAVYALGPVSKGSKPVFGNPQKKTKR